MSIPQPVVSFDLFNATVQDLETAKRENEQLRQQVADLQLCIEDMRHDYTPEQLEELAARWNAVVHKYRGVLPTVITTVETKRLLQEMDLLKGSEE